MFFKYICIDTQTGEVSKFSHLLDQNYKQLEQSISGILHGGHLNVHES